MDIFHKLHVADDSMATVGRSAIKVGAVDSSDYEGSYELAVTVYHPSTKAKRAFVMDYHEVAELAQTLTDWLREGFDGCIAVTEAERE